MTPDGTKITDWVLTIKNGAASCASVTIVNPATSESVLWDNTLAADMWIRFTSATRAIHTSVDSGTTWIRSNANVTGLVPRIKGGVSNAVTITGPTTGTYQYSYTAKGV